MTFHLNDKMIKDKWLRQYREEIALHKDKTEKERLQKVKEEQDYLDQIKRELEEDKMKNKYKKQQLIQSEIDDYYNHSRSKQKENEKSLEEKKMAEKVSLELGYEERLQKMKEYNNKLNERVEQNMHIYRNYNPNKKEKEEEDHPIDYRNTDSYYEKENEPTNEYTNENNNLQFRKETPNYDTKSEKANFEKDFYKYMEYKDLQKKVFNFNQSLILSRQKQKENELVLRKKTNEERLRELQNQNYMEHEEKFIKEQKQKIYKNLLDDQMGIKDSHINYSPNVNSSLNAINYPYKTPLILINKKKESDPHPYNSRTYELGGTILDHNPILNPVHNYKYNRYMYNGYDIGLTTKKDEPNLNQNLNSYSSNKTLQSAGRRVII